MKAILSLLLLALLLSGPQGASAGAAKKPAAGHPSTGRGGKAAKPAKPVSKPVGKPAKPARPAKAAKPVGKPRPAPAHRPAAAPASARGVSIPARYRGYTITRRNARLRAKVIALTFDDGPNPEITPLVLETLRQYNARATFFVLGKWAEEWPSLVRQEAAAGHAVESHSYSHPGEEINVPHARRELERTDLIIEQLTGVHPRLFRPPFGKLDWPLSKVAVRLGYCVTRWTVCGSDKPTENMSDIVRRITEEPQSGDIVLLHDGRSHIATARALPEVMRRLSARGYTFVTVPRLLQLWDAAKTPSKPAHARAAAGPGRGRA